MADTIVSLNIKDGGNLDSKLVAHSSSVGLSTAHILTGTVASDISASLHYTQSAAKSLYELSGTLNKISESIASGSVYNSTGSAQYLSIISGNIKDYTTALQNISSSVSSSLNIAGTSSAKYLQDISSSLATIGVGQDYSIYLTSSPGVTIAELMADISSSSAYSNTGSAKYLSYISEAVATIRDNSGQDYSTVLNNISSSLGYNSTGSGRYLSEISSSISSSLFGTTGNLYAGGKSAATWLSEISSSLQKISQSLSAGDDTTVLGEINTSLKAIDIDTTNISSSIVTTNGKLDTINTSIIASNTSLSTIATKTTNISSSVADISSSITYISQSTVGYATQAVITKITSSDFTSGIYQITGTTSGDTTPSNRVTVQILSKVNNKSIYLQIGTQTVTFASSMPSLFSYEMIPSGSYYAFDADLRLPHRILSGSALAADDYILITQTFR